ncbi:unnamed protein product [Ilex paraguariensis]
MDPASVASLADFIKKQFGKLDLLVVGSKAKMLKEILKEGYEQSEACLGTNYYGVKHVTKALLPLLQKSNSARLVNLMSHERAKEELGDVNGLTEEKVDEVVKGFLKDVKEGLQESKGWPINFSIYMVSKAALNAYTRILTKTYPNIAINAVCPGSVKTYINYNCGIATVKKGAKSPVMLALMPDGGPSGIFYSCINRKNVVLI